MNSTSIKDYSYPEFFDHYFNNDEEWINTYESPLLDYVLLNLPSYVNTIINFGCANGRDFIPFENTHKCIGFDLAKPSAIKWACKTNNLTYYQCSMEDYLTMIDHSETHLSTSLVYTQGALMYLSHLDQNLFIDHLLNKKCKNIVFHEYPPEQQHDQGFFNPSPEHLKLFERKHFRKIKTHNQPTGFLYLNK